MSEAVQQKTTGDHPIAEVSRLLRIPMPTLRSWESRYGIPRLSRENGRHRRYSDGDVHALRLMRDEIARGKRASDAAKSVRALLGISGPAADLIESFLAASVRLDTVGVRAELTRATEELGLGGCIDDVLMPAMRQVGLWWESGRCEIEQEHLTTDAARAWIDKRSAFAPPPTSPQPILLACGPGDLHTMGLEALALLLREQGLACRVLGAHASTPVLTTAAQATGAAGVVIVSHLPSARRRALASLASMEELKLRVFYAGNSFLSPRSRQGVPGTFLGSRLSVAANIIVGSVRSGRE